LLVLVWAPFVPLARVAMGIHYLSDVIAGALFGIAMGLITLYVYPLLVLHLSPHLLF
jgi:undecaprenyl-diphosphatase